MEPWGQGFRDVARRRSMPSRRPSSTGASATAGIRTPLERASNAAVAMDPAGQRKLDKGRGTGRIDGLVALAMAIGLAERAQAPARSIYDSGERAEGFLFM